MKKRAGSPARMPLQAPAVADSARCLRLRRDADSESHRLHRQIRPAARSKARLGGVRRPRRGGPAGARLHDLIGARFVQGDRLVYLGNYLGYGEEVAATVDELLDFRRRVLGRSNGFACDVVYLRGAQEEMWQKLLQLQFAPNPGEVLAWMVQAGVEATVRAYGGDLRQGFAATRDGPRTITRWTSALRTAMNAAEGHHDLVRLIASRRLHRARRGCFSSMPEFISGARSMPRATRSGGGQATSSSSPRRTPASAASSAASTVTAAAWSSARFGVSVDGGAGRGGTLQAVCLAADGAIVDFCEG